MPGEGAGPALQRRLGAGGRPEAVPGRQADHGPADRPGGPADPLVAAQPAASPGGTAVPWTKPEDLPYDPDKSLPALGGVFKDGAAAAFADGSVKFLTRDVDEETIRA